MAANEMHAARIRNLEYTHGVRVSDEAHPFALELFKEYGDHEPALQGMDPLQLVEKACAIVKKNIDPTSDSEEKSLDWDDYFLDRAYVEVMELRKEKSVACRTDVLPRVEKELAEIRTKLENFKNQWSLLVVQQRQEAEKRPEMLRRLKYDLYRFITSHTLTDYVVPDLAQLPTLLRSVSDELQRTVLSEFKERLVVGPNEIAQAASVLTELPAKCFFPPFKLRMLLPDERLNSRLSEKLIGLDGVINKIVTSLSKQKRLCGPLGSFLLLGPYGCGRSKLAEALAVEIYGDKNRFMKVDMSMIREPTVTLQLAFRFSRFKKNGCVVMFDKIENAKSFYDEILPQIHTTGRLGDAVNFSNDIVLVSSHLGHEVFFDCECLHDTIPNVSFREILYEPAFLHEGNSANNCHLLQFCERISNRYNSEFLDLFNDVLVFPWLTLQNHMAISRLQTRDDAEAMGHALKKPVITYPSDAAVDNMMYYPEILQRGAHAYETWHTLHMRPKVSANVLKEAEGKAIIYIDQLVGLGKEFSFRIENVSHLIKDPTHLSFKESLFQLRRRYFQEKQHAYYIYNLQTKCSRLCDLISTETSLALEESRDAMQLIKYLTKFHANEAQLDKSRSEAEASKASSCTRRTKRPKISLEEVSRSLQSSLELQDKATLAIAEALLKRLQTSHDDQNEESNNVPASFLCLGLTPNSKKQFTEKLEELLDFDDGHKLVFEVDLSLCTEPDSCFWFPCSMNTNLLLTQAVKSNPHCVVIFHDLELAHMSVFSTILSILDFGVAVDSEGNKTSFESCVVVIISDLGNKEIISTLVREFPKFIPPVDQKEAASTSGGAAVGSSQSGEKGKQVAVGSSSQSGEMVKYEAAGSSSTSEIVKQKEAAGSSSTSETVKQKEAAGSSSSTNKKRLKGLRFELLYRLDKLLLFDPFSDDQLNRYAMLSMKALEEKALMSLYKAFYDLFKVESEKKQSEELDEIIKHIEEALGEVLQIRS